MLNPVRPESTRRDMVPLKNSTAKCMNSSSKHEGLTSPVVMRMGAFSSSKYDAPALFAPRYLMSETQRFYQALTSYNPPPGPPYQSTSNWASLPAGPGTAKPLNSEGESSRGVTTFRVSTKDRKFIDEVEYRGWKIRVADWLHLSNPDDPSKPIVGQVFKCYVSEEP